MDYTYYLYVDTTYYLWLILTFKNGYESLEWMPNEEEVEILVVSSGVAQNV